MSQMGSLADILAISRHVRFGSILLQKSVAGFFGQWFRRCDAIRDGSGPWWGCVYRKPYPYWLEEGIT
jgi:hypothetical protein